MNKVYAHKNKDYSKYINKIIISLIPLILYGIYKNGIILYTNKYINIVDIFKPLFIPLIGLIIGILIDYLKHKKIIFENSLYGLIIGMIMPLNINYILFIVCTFSLLFLLSYLDKIFTVNKICLIKLIIILILFIMNSYSYANPLELEAYKYSYNILYLLGGRVISGISISSTILIFLSYLYLSITSYYYKKDIPFYLISIYLLIMVVYSVISGFNVNNFINPNIYFAFIFIAPLISTSPYTKTGKLIYSLLIALISSILIIWNNNFEIVYLCILFVSLCSKMFDKIRKIDYNSI